MYYSYQLLQLCEMYYDSEGARKSKQKNIRAEALENTLLKIHGPNSFIFKS